MTPYLRRRPNGRYFVQVKVPADLWKQGQPRLVERYLKTGDFGVARTMAPAVVKEITDGFEARRHGQVNVAAALDHIATDWKRKAYDAIADGRDVPSFDVISELKARNVAGNLAVAMDAISMAAAGAENARQRWEHRGPQPDKAGPWKAPAATAGVVTETLAHLESYLATLAGLTPKRVRQVESMIRELIGELPTLADVNRAAVQSYIDSFKGAPGTLRGKLVAPRRYWQWLRSRLLVPDDTADPFDSKRLMMPVRGKAAKAEAERRARKPWTVAEYKRLMAQARKDKDSQLADLILIAAHTGRRREDICGLQVHDVDLKAKTFTVTDAKSVAGNAVIPIHPAIFATMKRLCEDATDEYLFSELPADQDGFRGGAIGGRFRVMKQGMGFGGDKVLHCFRKTVAGALRNAGVAEHIIDSLCGWKDDDGNMLARYAGGTEIPMKAKRAAIAKLTY